MQNYSRNYGIDILRCLCAFLVICIHIPFPGEIGKYIVSIARVAVPIFFIISGFYYRDVLKQKKEKKQLSKVINLILLSNLLYLIVDIFIHIYKGDLLVFIDNLLSFKTISKCLLFNVSPFYSHLWYLNALLYVLLFYLLFLKRLINHKRLLLIISVILLVIDLLFGKYSLVFFNRQFNFILIRNFAFVGIPYFTIGILLNDWLINKKSINNLKVLLLILIFSVLTIIERFILIYYNMNTIRDHYISTTFLSISLFIFFCYYKPCISLLSSIGKKHSSNIYIIHPVFILLLSFFITKIYDSIIVDVLSPFIVFFLSIIYSFLLFKIKNCINKKKCVR